MSKTSTTGAIRKFHCHCVMGDESETYLIIKAKTEVEASKKAHKDYNVQYVLDVLTPLQMEVIKKKLRTSRSLYGGTALHA